MRELSMTVGEENGGKRVSRLALGVLHMSQTQFKSAKFQGELLLDGRPVHADALADAGQTLVVRMPEESGPLLAPYPLALCVPYRDEDILVVDKPAPLPSVRSRQQDGLTLENAVYSFLGCPQPFVYHPINRLDKGTSGLMVVALHPHAQQLLQRALHTEAFAREYLAVCDGCPPQSEGTVDLPIAKAEGATIRREISPDGQEAVTHYRVLERTKSRSLVWLRLETGRTHQIRVHMAALGCPVTGDFLYGREVAALPQRFALHSHRLYLNHPATGKRMEWVSPLPQTLRTLLDDSAELL